MKMENKELERIKKELLFIYSSFLVNPENKDIKEKAKKIDEDYSGLLSYSQHASKEILPKHVLDAIGNISLIYEYGLYDENHPAFSKEKIKKRIEEIIKTLK